jgi:hypothetical protein
MSIRFQSNVDRALAQKFVPKLKAAYLIDLFRTPRLITSKNPSDRTI